MPKNKKKSNLLVPIILIGGFALVAYLLYINLGGIGGLGSMPAAPNQFLSPTFPWQPMTTPPAEELPAGTDPLPAGSYFDSILSCNESCEDIGYDTGFCQWESEATGAYLGTCWVEGSRHCGIFDQCGCYCENIEEPEPAPDGDLVCDNLCTIFGYDYGYERTVSCLPTEIMQPDASGTSCCCGDEIEPEPEPEESVGWAACDAFRIAEGKPFYTLIEPIPDSLVDGCYDYAWAYCDGISKWLTTYDILEPDCCVFRCSE